MFDTHGKYNDQVFAQVIETPGFTIWAASWSGAASSEDQPADSADLPVGNRCQKLVLRILIV